MRTLTKLKTILLVLLLHKFLNMKAWTNILKEVVTKFLKILNRKVTSEEVIKVLSESKLSGLGGAGFSSGKKWEIVKGFDKPKFMTVNGDEGEPGTFKDRFWIENKPHQLFEGALIAAHVVGCEKIYFYIRDEYPACIEILKRELDKLKKRNLVKVPIEIRRGAGLFIYVVKKVL